MNPSVLCFTKSLWIGGGGGLRFSVENFLTHSAENFRTWGVVGESFIVSLISGIEKFHVAER